MPDIDKLIEKMMERGGTRMVIAGDRAICLFVGEREGSGPVIATARLSSLLDEIVPHSLAPNLGQDCRFQFPHQSPLGIFQIEVERSKGQLRVILVPFTGI